MCMYDEAIANAVPEADSADYPEILWTIRYCILNAEPNWVPTEVFNEMAKLAYEVVLAIRKQDSEGNDEPQPKPSGPVGE